MTELQPENTSLAKLEIDSSVSSAPHLARWHFWISSFPYFETTLIVAPPLSFGAKNFPLQLTIYDADGELCNQVSLELPISDAKFIELEPFLGACKIESGIKHAHLVVKAPSGAAVQCRIHTREGATMLGQAHEVSEKRGAFFPLTFCESRSSLVCCINTGDQAANLRCRLFYARRSPEAVWQIPAHASRVVHLETEFIDYIEQSASPIQGYIRLGAKSGKLAVQLIERSDSVREGGVYSAVS